jgi:hypothetical protein
LLLSSYEGVRPKRAGWFFHEDLTPDLFLWPIGFFFIGKPVVSYPLGPTFDLQTVSGIVVSLALFFAIGVNLAALACLLPISLGIYAMLIVPIVILADALTGAFIFAAYYIVRSLAFKLLA